MWEYFVFLMNKNFFLMCEFFFLGMKSMTVIAVVWKSVFPWFYLMYYLFHCKRKNGKKMLMWIKRSFVWLKKIVLDESFYEIVFFSHVVAFCSCGGLGKCLVWFEVFFLFIWWFFSTTRWNTITVFSLLLWARELALRG